MIHTLKHVTRQLARRNANRRRSNSKLPRVCIDWGDSTLFVVQVDTNANLPVAPHTWQLKFPGGRLLEGAPQDVGAWLRQEWSRNGIPKVPVFVSAPRRQVALKTFLQNVVAGSELAETVLLQIESRYPMPLDQLIVDFVTQPCTSRPDRMVVLSGAVARSVVESIQAIVSAASLELLGIGVGELGLGALSQNPDRTAYELSVLANHAKIEILVAQGPTPIMSHAIGVPSQTETLLAEVDKLIEHIRGRLAELEIALPTTVSVYGPLAPLVEPLFASRFGTVRRSQLGSSQSARGLALAAACREPESMLDFLNPRRPPNVRALRRQKSVRVATVAGLVVAGLAACGYGSHVSLDRKLAGLRDQHAALRGQIEGTESTLLAAQAISRWDESRIPWSVELAELLEHLGSNERCYLERVQLESSADSSEPTVRLQGVARENRDALAIADRLVNDAKQYRVQPGPIQPNRRDPHYQAAFDFRIQWAVNGAAEPNDAQD
jgi:hypothetical protein